MYNNDLQREFKDLKNQHRKMEMEESPQLTLGKMLNSLNTFIENGIKPDTPVYLDCDHLKENCKCLGICSCNKRCENHEEYYCKNCECRCECDCNNKYCELCYGKYDTRYTVIYLDSWRGSYAELAFTMHEIRTGDENVITLKNLIEMLQDANGETFQGYKGGDFTMSRNTPLWICHGYGISVGNRSGDTGIVGVKHENNEIIIMTEDCSKYSKECCIM